MNESIPLQVTKTLPKKPEGPTQTIHFFFIAWNQLSLFLFQEKTNIKPREGEFYFLETELGSSLEGPGKASVAWLRF